MAAGVVSFIAHYLTLYACIASIITYLARIFCLSPVKVEIQETVEELEHRLERAITAV